MEGHGNAEGPVGSPVDTIMTTDPLETWTSRKSQQGWSGGSSMTSPLKNMGALFQKRGDEGTASTKRKRLKHSVTLPELSSQDRRFSMKSIQRSLRFSKRHGGEEQKTEKVLPSELPQTENHQMNEEREEIAESYTPPQLLHTPLSVMQIHQLIEVKELEEAHLNLLSLRQEFQEEQGGEEKASTELANKEKDLHLLYRELRDKLKAVVRDSLSSVNTRLLVSVARIVQEEERRAGEAGGLPLPGGWRELWREAVREGVRATVDLVPLQGPEQNLSWLVVHLGQLGQTVVQHLGTVKTDLRGSYPPSFKVFSTYVTSYNLVVGQHLKSLQQQVKELKDYLALSDWILNIYKSEKILGSPTLCPEMQSESKELILDEDFPEQLREQYCRRLKIDMRSSLEKILEMEKEFWMTGESNKDEEGFLHSSVDMDIMTRVQGIVQGTRRVDALLGQQAIHSCLEELKPFPKRFEEALMSCVNSAGVYPITPTLRAKYTITYIHMFTSLKQKLVQHRASCPGPESELSLELDSLLGRLGHSLEEQYKDDVKPFIGKMMTKKWLTNDEDFQKLSRRTVELSEQSALMRPPAVQGLVDRLHLHTMRDYISQLMNTSYSCRRHEEGASKFQKQWRALHNLFIDMKSTHEWLRPLGHLLSDIIGQADKRAIKEHLLPLVEHYPDLREEHLAAVLSFRGLRRGRERQAILQHFSELQKTSRSSAASGSLFRDLRLTGNTDWLAQLPSSCLAFLR